MKTRPSLPWVLTLAMLFCSSTLAFSQCGCTFLISSNASDIYFDGVAKNAKPGDRICFPNGTRTGIQFKNLAGTPEKPIIISNRCDGKSTILAPANWGNTIEFINCHNVVLTGAANPAEFYGIDAGGAMMGVQIHDLSTDFTVDHMYIHDVSCTPLQAKTNPTCDTKTWRGNFTLRNLDFHDLKLENTGCEAFYVGNSHYDLGVPMTCSSVPITVQEHDVDNVLIYNCILNNIGNDGIQVGAATNAVIHHNVVNGTGIKNNPSHMNGIQMGSGTTNALVYNNNVDQAHGNGIFDSGGGGTYYNNVVTNALESGIFLRDDAPLFAPRGFTIINNTFVNNKNNSIYMLSENVSISRLENNIIVTPTGDTHVHLNNSKVKWSEANNIKTFDVNSVKFINPATRDYHLQKTSTGVDAGKNETGDGISFDLDGKPRPKGTAFDMGAYEFQPGGPTANAGGDKSITLPTANITLNGSGTSIAGISGYQWTKKVGGAATLQNDGTANLTVISMVEGAYTFELRVTDADGFALDEVQVTVLPAAANQNPVAQAGSDQEITLPIATATFNGIGTDADGSISKYEWTKISGPLVTLGPVDAAKLDVSVLLEGTYVFQLTVTDDDLATASDQVSIVVHAAGVNQLPVVDAGTTKTIFLPIDQISLTAVASDPDGTISKILWEKKSGGVATLGATNLLTLDVTGLALGSYTFKVTVTDDDLATKSAEVIVQVLQGNQSPTANAGPDQPLTLPTNSIVLTGSGTDLDGSISTYAWVKVSGPAATLANDNTASLTVTNMVQGAYVFGLTVTDNGTATGYDEVTVAVSVAPVGPNETPLAIAGGNVSFSLPTITTNLYGSGFDADGTITTYSWAKASGGTATLSNTDKPTVTITDLEAGQYVFRLTVTDDKGVSDDDEATVTVSEAGTNIFPVASASADKIVRLPQNSVNLSGSGTDEDGTVTDFAWTQLSGAAVVIGSPSTPATTVSGLLEGNYSFRLTVTDDKDATDFNDVIVRVVSSTNNLPPVVDAGSDVSIFLPQSTLTLNAAASDDGSITTYSWAKLSGPTVTLTNPQELNLSLTALVQGDYSFQLTVTDNNAASVFDIVRVSVLPATFNPPVVNAGSDQEITLPDSQVTLTGTATSPSGSISTTTWVETLGPAATLAGDNSLSLTVTNMLEGTYLFKLTATDNTGKDATDNVQVIVHPVPPNQPPLVSAGSSALIALPTSSATLTGTASDPDGTISKTVWTQVSGPSNATLTNDQTLSVTASNLVAGTYTLKLTATDNLQLTAFATGFIIVSDPDVSQNSPPVVYAGADTTLVKPAENMVITGIAVDAEGPVDKFEWEQVSGTPATFTVNGAILDIVNPDLGIYEFKLTGTDDDGASASDNVIVTVIEKNQEIPKFFSPNNDGFGEFWVFRNIDAYQTCKLSVFNHTGQVVYEAAPYQNNWDGTYNGKALSDGDYYYDIRCDDGKKIKGAVRIIR